MVHLRNRLFLALFLLAATAMSGVAQSPVDCLDYCPTEYSGNGSHAFFMPGIADDLVFDKAGDMVVNIENGTVSIRGVVSDPNNSQVCFAFDVTLSSMVEPGMMNYPPAGSPKKELAANKYKANAGPIDPTGWQYFEVVDGYLVGLKSMAGAMIHVTRFGPAAQLGMGANGKNTTFGLSTWLDVNILAQPTTGDPLAMTGSHGDINLNVGGCVNMALDGSVDDFQLKTGINNTVTTSGPGEMIKHAVTGDTLYLDWSSPNGLFDYESVYFFAACTDNCVATPIVHPTIPQIWLDPFSSATVQLTGPGNSIFGDIPVLPGGTHGISSIEPGFVGYDITLQAFILSPLANNGVYAATEGHRIVVNHSPMAANVTSNLVALYEFNEGNGNVVTDTSNNGSPLNLTIADPSRVTWNNGSLKIDQATVIDSVTSGAKIANAVMASNEMTIETWIKPDNDVQSGPARIVTMSNGTSERNFTLGQKAEQYDFRFRTDGTNTNGIPSVDSAHVVETNKFVHLVYVRTDDGQVRIYRDGCLETSSEIVGSTANWDTSFKLSLGNEQSMNRAWLGELGSVAIYDRALSQMEVKRSFNAGSNAR